MTMTNTQMSTAVDEKTIPNCVSERLMCQRVKLLTGLGTGSTLPLNPTTHLQWRIVAPFCLA